MANGKKAILSVILFMALLLLCSCGRVKVEQSGRASETDAETMTTETDISEKVEPTPAESFAAMTKPVATDDVTEKDGILLSSDGKTFVGITERFSGQTLFIPDGVERIAAESVCYTNVTTLIIPDSVTVIEDNAVIFNDAMQYVSVQGKAVIGAMAFYHNLTLKEVDAPNVRAIGTYAFGTCLSLRRIDAPNVQYIGTCAFCGCSSLYGVTFPNVTEIGEAVFCDCSSLTYADMPLLQTIPFRTFESCTALLCADYPCVLSIGDAAFKGCKSLQSLNVPMAREIGDGAFTNTAARWFILPNWQAKGEDVHALFARAYNSYVDGPVVPVIYAEATAENAQCAASLKFELRNLSEIADCSVVNDWVTVSMPLYLYDDTGLVAITDADTPLLLPRFSVSAGGVWSTVLYDRQLYRVKTIQLEQTDPNEYLRNHPVSVTEIQPLNQEGRYGDFTFEEYDDHILVTGYLGGSTDVIIPEVIRNKPVTTVSRYLFGSLTIPGGGFMSHCVTSVLARSVTAFDSDGDVGADGTPHQSLFFFSTHQLTTLIFPKLEALSDGCWVGDCHLTTLDLASCNTIDGNSFVRCQIDNLILPSEDVYKQESFPQCTVENVIVIQP